VKEGTGQSQNALFLFLASVKNQIATAVTLELLLVAFHISQNVIF